jgi:CheY-like chemotaxis protein
VEDTKYCLCCGEHVPYNFVERYEKRELTCAYCGFVLDVQQLWEPPRSSEGYTLIAEDSQFIRTIITNVLKTKKFSAKVSAFENGLELISAFTKLVAERASIDVAIIDLNMPVMDGITAARTIRAIESQQKIAATPFVFFSSMKADDALRAQMELLQPATYMNKGTDPDPDKLSERVELIVGYLMEKYAK